MAESADETKRTWFERLSNMLIREPKDRAQLMDVLRDAEERELLSADMLSMIESVLQVSEMHVREVMIPKSQMVVINRSDTLEKILPIIIDSAHSRFPVIDDESDDVFGILLAKDVLQFFFNRNKTEFQVADIVRPAVFVPQSKRLDVLLREFRVKRNHMAIVIDEYGLVAGLVTIEDLLEQIVGDIEDEYDTDEEDDIKNHADNSYTVKATTSIDDFNEYFNTDFNDDEFDTIGGIVLKEFSHMPKRGESIKVKGYRFKVLHSDNRRIHLIEVKTIDQAQ